MSYIYDKAGKAIDEQLRYDYNFIDIISHGVLARFKDNFTIDLISKEAMLFNEEWNKCENNAQKNRLAKRYF